MMMTQTDQELLSAYIDNELNAQDRATLEARLQSDPALQTELDLLRQTVQQVRNMPMLKAPRNYTLDPAMYGAQPNNIIGWQRRGLAAAAVILVLGFVAAITVAVFNQSNDAALTSSVDGIAQEAAPADEVQNEQQAPSLTQSAVDTSQAQATAAPDTSAEIAVLPSETPTVLMLASPTFAATSTPLPTNLPPIPEALQGTSTQTAFATPASDAALGGAASGDENRESDTAEDDMGDGDTADMDMEALPQVPPMEPNAPADTGAASIPDAPLAPEPEPNAMTNTAPSAADGSASTDELSPPSLEAPAMGESGEAETTEAEASDDVDDMAAETFAESEESAEIDDAPANRANDLIEQLRALIQRLFNLLFGRID